MLKNLNHAKPNRVSVALLTSGVVFSVVAQLIFALPASAECFYDGETFETGDTVGSLICMPDGSWQPQ
jgi:hypothetical protein